MLHARHKPRWSRFRAHRSVFLVLAFGMLLGAGLMAAQAAEAAIPFHRGDVFVDGNMASRSTLQMAFSSRHSRAAPAGSASTRTARA
jgi:hypothetical protein